MPQGIPGRQAQIKRAVEGKTFPVRLRFNSKFGEKWDKITRWLSFGTVKLPVRPYLKRFQLDQKTREIMKQAALLPTAKRRPLERDLEILLDSWINKGDYVPRKKDNHQPFIGTKLPGSVAVRLTQR